MANAKANNARNAVKAASKEATKPATQAPAPEAPAEDLSRFVGKLCKVTGGRRFKDETHGIFHVTKGNAYRKPLALASGKDGEVLFIQPKFLEIVGDMDKAELAKLQKKQDDQRNETLYVAAFAKTENDEGITLSYPGWARNLWFAKAKGEREAMISLTGCEDSDGKKIFEIVAWKVKRECGEDGYNALKAKQDALAAIVEAKA